MRLVESLNHESLSFYRVYGLLLKSDVPIPNLTPIERQSHQLPLVSVQFRARANGARQTTTEDELLWYTSDFSDEHGNPALRIWKRRATNDYCIRYSHGLEFLANGEANSITVDCTNETTMREAAEFLLGPMLGILLRLRGITCLHASAVAIDGAAIAFAGPPGAGKSTTAGLLVQGGYAALADDIVPLREYGGSFDAIPGFPGLNLWPESRAMLEGRLQTLSADQVATEKQQWAIGDGQGKFCCKALPLGVIYLLGEREGGPNAPRVEPMTAQAALMNLIANTFANKLPDVAIRAKEFAFLGQLMNQVPVRRLVPHKDPTRLQELREVILDDFSAARKRTLAAAQC